MAEDAKQEKKEKKIESISLDNVVIRHVLVSCTEQQRFGEGELTIYFEDGTIDSLFLFIGPSFDRENDYVFSVSRESFFENDPENHPIESFDSTREVYKSPYADAAKKLKRMFRIIESD